MLVFLWLSLVRVDAFCQRGKKRGGGISKCSRGVTEERCAGGMQASGSQSAQVRAHNADRGLEAVVSRINCMYVVMSV